jgi:hypothetical protein
VFFFICFFYIQKQSASSVFLIKFALSTKSKNVSQKYNLCLHRTPLVNEHGILDGVKSNYTVKKGY